LSRARKNEVSVRVERLLFAIILQGMAGTAAFAQVKTLPVALVNVCGPELDASSKCQRGEAGLSTLRGSQAKLVRRLADLNASATVADIQRIVGSSPVENSAAGSAVLDGKLIERRIARWSLTWDSSLGPTEPQDQMLIAVFVNGLLMNLQFGGVAIPRAGLYFAALDCEPNCAGKLRMVGGVK